MGSVISTVQDTVSGLSQLLTTVVGLNAKYQALFQRALSDPGLPTTTPTRPYWLDEPPFPDLTDIQQPLPKEADVVIVGSGITGVAAAKTLLELGAPQVVVLEARGLCSGATGRNGGHVKCVPYQAFAALRKKLGDERAREVVRFQMRHVKVLGEVGEMFPRGEMRQVETVDMYLEQDDFEKAKKCVGEARVWMPEVEMTVWEGDQARDKFGVNGHVAGAVSYKAGACWPYRLVTSIWDDLRKRYPEKLILSTHTPVEGVTTTSSTSHPHRIQTLRGGVMQARQVLHATNGFASHLIPSLRGSLTGVLAHMSAQRPGADFPACHGRRSWSVIYGPNHFEYVTQRPDEVGGGQGDLMIGGGLMQSKEQGLDQIGVWDDGRVDVLVMMHIRGSMSTVFEGNWGAGGGELVKAWTGILGFTGDTMPLVGRLPSATSQTRPATSSSGVETKESGQYIAAGFNGEGMVWAWLCGTAVAIMMLGREGEELGRGVGRPGGRLEEWFPREVRVDQGRLRRADLKNLAGEV